MKRCLIQVLLLTSILCYPVDHDNDEKRPYEFGFTIDGEQHRYEKKDEKGIIMGEFGFITADGIYHVTVYATDENGDFKIISMKNIKVGFPPGKTTTTTTAKPKPQTNLLLTGIKGCSGCLIPETSPTMAPKGHPPGSRAFHKMDLSDDRNSNFNKDTRLPSIPMNHFKATDNSKTVPLSYEEYGREQQGKQGPQKSATLVPSNIPNSIPDQGHIKQLNDKTQSTQIPGSRQTTDLFPKGLTPNLIQHNNFPINPKSQPQLNEVEMKILDYMARLYKFNYTLSFHGHEEMGDLGGNKNGSYFSNGRDGYQRKVVYIANEFGYQPKISLIKLDDKFIPKEETEKELTKLKGSEFIWFNKKK